MAPVHLNGYGRACAETVAVTDTPDIGMMGHALQTKLILTHARTPGLSTVLVP